MARALWKGHLKLADFACPVALHAAATTSERVSFRTINRRTGNPVRREYVDAETDDPVGREDQVKGYEVEKDQFVVLSAEDLDSVAPESDKTLRIEAFLDCPQIDTAHFDKPYYLVPADRGANEAFALIREGMRTRNAAALARAVLFRRIRTVMIRAQGPGLVADTLNFDYEVRSAAQAFKRIGERRVEPEMLDLAKHIIKTKRGAFEPAAFRDSYDEAVRALVQAKAEGRAPPKTEARKPAPVVDLMEALRQSAAASGKGGKAAAKRGGARTKGETPRRKAG
jgi:DNA end-binding protein Ku